MHDNEASDTVYVEQDISDALRLTTFSSFTSPREDNTRDNDRQPTLPLGVELTGYYLFTIGVILGVGIPKAVCSYQGQALISTTLDWLGGTALALILFCLGVIDAKRPGLSPRFFQVDLAPPILRRLCHPGVYFFFLQAVLISLGATLLQVLLDSSQDFEPTNNMPARVIEDGFAQSVLAFSIATCVFCLQCMRAIWPRVFRGLRRDALLFIISSVIFIAYFLYLQVKVFFGHGGSEIVFLRPIFGVALHNLVWMSPQVSRKMCSNAELGYFSGLLWIDLMMPALEILDEAMLIWGPDFRGSLYDTLLVECLLVWPLYRSVYASWICTFAHTTWSTSKASYDRVRGAGNKARGYV